MQMHAAQVGMLLPETDDANLSQHARNAKDANDGVAAHTLSSNISPILAAILSK